MTCQEDPQKRGIILVLTLLALCKSIESIGLCEYEMLFQSENMVFLDEISTESKVSSLTTQISTATTCPTNMVFGNCTCGASCEDPLSENGCYDDCTDDEGCICPRGFLMTMGQCVYMDDCGCFLLETDSVIPNNAFYVNRDCTRRCACRDGDLVCEEDYQCSDGTVCEERNNIRQCYCEESGLVWDGVMCTLPTDCYDIYNNGSTETGIYTIKPVNWYQEPFEVRCNMDTAGGGWTVFQRRVDGHEDFYRYWEDYKYGFGNPDHELWLGNEKILYITNQKEYQLYIDLVDSDGASFYARYTLFRIANESDNYRLTLGRYSDGNSGPVDAMSGCRDRAFSTPDRDNDASTRDCAVEFYGAWWYNDCVNANLNGGYFETFLSGIYWYTLPGNEYNIPYTEMKIRPVRN